MTGNRQCDLEGVVEDLLARVRHLEDAEAARNHLHAYASALDDPHPDKVSALFTAQATLRVPSGDIVGRDAIAEFYRARSGPDVGEKRHFITDLRTRHKAPGVVEVASYFVFVSRDADASGVGWGTYLDTIEVGDGSSLFSEKVIAMHVATDLGTGWARPLGG